LAEAYIQKEEEAANAVKEQEKKKEEIKAQESYWIIRTFKSTIRTLTGFS